MSTRKVVRIVAYDRDGVELGAIDGDELRLKLNPIGEQLLIDNGYRSFFGEETGYTESDLTEGRDADIARMCIEVVER